MDNISNKLNEDLLLELEKAKNAYDALQFLYQKEINEKQKIESKCSSDHVLSQLLFQDHGSVMLLIDPLSGKIIDANKSAALFYNYPVDQLRGMLIDDINVLSKDEIEIEKVKALRKVQNQFIFPHRISNGEIRQVEVHSSPVELNGQKLLFSIIHDITDGEAVGNKLKKSEDALRKAEEIGKFGNWNLFLDEKLMRASNGAKLIYGLRQDEIPLDEIKGIALSEYRPMLDKALNDLILYGYRYDVEYKIRRKSDGIIVDIHSVAEFDASKNIVFGTIQDISERKRIEEARIESEKRFHLLFANMTEGAALHKLSYNNQGDPEDYVIIEINPAFEDQLGITREQVINKTSREAYGVTDPPFLGIYARVALSGNPEVFETYFPPLARHFSISVYSPYKGSFATIFVDITERKKAEQTIRESERRYHGLLDHLDAGIVVHAADTSIIMANPKAQELLGLSEEQMTGKPAIDPHWKFLQQDLSPMPLEEYPVNKIISSKKPIKDFLIGVHQPVTSDVVWLLVNGLPTLGENGGIDEVLISFTNITERKRIEDNLLESQQLLHEAQRLAQIGVWNWDNETNTVTWSEELCKIIGRDPDLPVPAFKDQQFVFTPESYGLFTDALENVKETGRKIEIELEIVHAGGGLRNVIGFVGIKNDSRGRIKGLYGTLQDITERKLTELALAEREELYRLLFENSGEAILYTQPDGNISSANPEACRIFGRSEEEICKSGRSGLIDITDPRLPGALEERRKTGKFKGELNMLRNDGALFQADISSATFKDSRGVEKTSMIIRDITERKMAEEALRESKNQLNLMLQTTDQGIYGIGPDGCCTFINQSGLSLLGYTTEECIGRNMHELIHHSYPDGSTYEVNECPIFNARNTGKGTHINSEVFWRKDGTAFATEYSSYPSFENGEISGAVITFADITERKRVEDEINFKNEELLRLVTEKDKLFSIIAHDLRSPFNAFLGFTRMMVEDLPKLRLDEIQTMALSMRTSATNLYRLLENLLEWSRLQRGMTGFEPKPLLLLPKIAASLQSVLESADKKGIETVFAIPDDLVVFADENMLTSTIRNLMSNSVKFTNKGGRITVNAKVKDNNTVEISVGDTGIGMNKTMLHKLFDPTSNLSRKGTEDELSTGLGLIICKDFVEKHGGKIWAESEEGKGSTFYFTVPGNTGQALKAVSKDVLDEGKNTPVRKLKIIIADDDETSQMLIAMAVKPISREIVKVQTGAAVVEACRNHPDADLVMMDIKMPDMDGYEATEQIRQFNKSVVIIAQTAFGLGSDREDALKSGCNDYLSKPIVLEALKELIQKHFKM